MKIIKEILIDGQGWFYAKDEDIVEFKVNGEMGFVSWYRQGDKEFNGKYVVEIVYKNFPLLKHFL